MLVTPNSNSIVFQGVPQEVQKVLTAEFIAAKARYGDFEVVVIAISDEDAYNVQIHTEPDKTFVADRISRNSLASDFRDVVERGLSH